MVCGLFVCWFACFVLDCFYDVCVLFYCLYCLDVWLEIFLDRLVFILLIENLSYIGLFCLISWSACGFDLLVLVVWACSCLLFCCA